ncbi:hypothetical protein BJY01DRAFT_52108 [Aspergillus pseudoustus]|uniref:Uncharacterized protein n=1 Tax=Aspergillus pseudoustus TaxID=1810923 RepID=A0ABR4JCV1_9EURO
MPVYAAYQSTDTPSESSCISNSESAAYLHRGEVGLLWRIKSFLLLVNPMMSKKPMRRQSPPLSHRQSRLWPISNSAINLDCRIQAVHLPQKLALRSGGATILPAAGSVFGVANRQPSTTGTPTLSAPWRVTAAQIFALAGTGRFWQIRRGIWTKYLTDTALVALTKYTLSRTSSPLISLKHYSLLG